MNVTFNIQLIPLNRLLVSQLNVRRTDRKAEIEALAASISSHGLLQNLTVVAVSGDKFEVTAGGRRLAALKALAKSGAIARDVAVPCQVVDRESAQEASLVENVQRVAMNAMDEVDAFATLRGADLSVEDIARRFGCNERHVEQRLALAALSPKLKSAYRRGDLTLDAARAFCIEREHAKQEAVFKILNKPVDRASTVRSHLTQGCMKTSDRLAHFVGLEAYDAAGGSLTRDLFDEDAVFINNPALIAKLAEERLQAMRTEYLAAGWGWANIDLSNSARLSGGGRRLYPTQRSMTAKEQKAIDKMDAALEALENDLADPEDDDSRWQERDDLENRRETMLESLKVWDSDLIAHAGVLLGVDYNGRLSVTFGLVAKGDEAALKKIEAARAKLETNDDGGPNASDEGCAVLRDAEEGAGPRLSKKLIADLSAARARALRLEISHSPDVALALLVFGLIQRSQFTQSVTGLNVRAGFVELNDADQLEASRANLMQNLPDAPVALLDWLFDQSRETLLNITAIVTASALDLVHGGLPQSDTAKQILGDQLAQRLDLDMRRYWSADGEFWSRLPKALLLDVLKDSPEIAALSEEERSKRLKGHAKLTRDALADRVAKAQMGSGWLPEMLITPVRSGALEVTQNGAAAVVSAA